MTTVPTLTGRNAVRQTLSLFLANPRIQNLNQIFTSFPKILTTRSMRSQANQPALLELFTLLMNTKLAWQLVAHIAVGSVLITP
jgi:hypothetical protein